jgi:hypothetical protein
MLRQSDAGPKIAGKVASVVEALQSYLASFSNTEAGNTTVRRAKLPPGRNRQAK